MASILCDTDFLIKISNDPIPALDFKQLSKENEFVVLPSVLGELKGLSASKNSRTARRARVALRVIDESRFAKPIFEIRSNVREADIDLVSFVMAKPRERIIATLDGSLLSRLDKLGLPYLTLSKERPLFSRSRESNIFNSRWK
jgi:rRNA-processing protein FCF1